MRFRAGWIALVTVALLSIQAHAVELVVMGRNSMIGRAVDAFNAAMAEQGRDVRATFIYEGLTHERLLVMHVSGTAPDVVSLDLIQGPKMYQAGVFTPLDRYLQEVPWVEELSPGMRRLGVWQGKTMMIPFFSDNSGLFVNLQRLAESGFPEEPPATWDELIEIARKTTNPEEDRYGMEALPKWGGGGYMFLWMPFVWSNGGRLLDDEGTRSLINSDEAEEALRLWHDLRNVHLVTRPSGSQFAQGKDTFELSGNWGVANLKSNFPDLRWTVRLMPTRLPDQQPSSFVGGDLVGITEQSQYKDLAWELVKFLLSEEVQVDLFAANGIIPVRRDLMMNEYFQAEPRYFVFAEAVNVGRAPYTVAYNELYEPLVRNLDPAVQGETALRQALVQLEQEINLVLREALAASGSL